MFRDFTKDSIVWVTRYNPQMYHIQTKIQTAALVAGGSKNFARLMGCGRKHMWPIFKNEMLIYQSKATLDVKILFGKIIHL